MKIIFLLALQDYQQEVIDLFKKAGMEIISRWPVEGLQLKSVLSDGYSWFGGQQISAASQAYMSICKPEQAQSLLALVKEANENNKEEGFPFHAFMLHLEEVV